jgi:hypothetical protein
MKAYTAVEVYVHSFLTSALDGGQWLTSRLGLFPLGKEPRYQLNSKLDGPQSQSLLLELNLILGVKVKVK